MKILKPEVLLKTDYYSMEIKTDSVTNSIIAICCDKCLEDIIKNNFESSWKFSRQISVAEFLSSYNLAFAVHKNFAHASETYDSMNFN